MKVQHDILMGFERYVLGSVLMKDTVMEELVARLQPGDFVSSDHRFIFEAMVEMYGESKPITMLTLVAELDRMKFRGGAFDVARLTENIPSSNIRYYVDQILKESTRRQLLAIARKSQNELEDGATAEDVIDGMEQALVDISSDRVAHGYVPAHVALLNATNRIQNVRETGREVWLAQTGIRILDSMLGGLEAETYAIIGARPSVGKSAMALQIAMDIAGRQRKSVAFFTLEMADRALMIRAIAQHLRIDSKYVKLGRLSDVEMKRIIEYGAEVSAMKLYINDQPNIRLVELRSQARIIKQRHGLDVLVVDYLTLIRGDTRLPRWEQVSGISGALKEIARELGIAVIALSQLGRDVDNKRPTLASLRESGAIEQDADIVILLHRGKEPDVDMFGKVLPSGVEVILAKNREGSVGRLHMTFVPQFTRFEEREQGDEYAQD